MSLVIVTSHWKEDMNWLKKSKWPVVVVAKEGSDPIDPPPNYVIPNRGLEASSYFKYIIENYDSLPDFVAFIHGHETDKHQFHDAPLLDVIEHANIEEHEFISLNNLMRVYHFVDEDPRFMSIETYWDIFGFPSEMKPPRLYPLVIPICAQFIVSKKRILRHPKESYERWFNLVMNEKESRNYYPLFLECVWHIIFGEPWQCPCPKSWFTMETRDPVWWHPDLYKK